MKKNGKQNAKCKISLESLMKLKNLEIVVISKPIKRPILIKFPKFFMALNDSEWHSLVSLA